MSLPAGRLLWHQYRYDQKTFWRQPESVFFTVALPLIFLFLFVSIFGNGTIDVGGHLVKGSTYYVPGIVTLAMVSATVLNLSISMAIARERGRLKRVRSTPLPPWVFLAGRIGTASGVTALLVVAVTGLGRLVYGVSVPTNTLGGLALTVLVGTAAGCALGFALATAIPSESSAPAVTNAVILPLYFFSGIFIPSEDIPATMRAIGDVFPVKHLFEALLTAFDPRTTGAGIAWADLAVVAAWGLLAAVVATRRFRWAPRSG
ncbi:MAG: ABC transporter permease [Acidimicrobiales bacterium]